MNPISNKELTEIINTLREAKDAFYYLVMHGLPTYGEERYNQAHLAQIEQGITRLLNKLESW